MGRGGAGSDVGWRPLESDRVSENHASWSVRLLPGDRRHLFMRKFYMSRLLSSANTIQC